MSRIAYVNGRYLPHGEAMVHIEDRGYQFSDGVYEVVGVKDGRLFDEEQHLDRLERSLGEIAIAPPMSRSALKSVVHETLRRNRIENGLVYIQVTRGVAPPEHAVPPRSVPPRRGRPPPPPAGATPLAGSPTAGSPGAPARQPGSTAVPRSGCAGTGASRTATRPSSGPS